MKTMYHHVLLLSFILFVFLVFHEKFFFLILFLCTFYWQLRTHNHSWIFAAVLMISIHFLHGEPQKPVEITQASVVKVSDTYAIIKADNISYLCYVDEILPLDAIVHVEGTITETERRKGFYRFDEKKWCKTINVFYKIEDPVIHVVKEKMTIRHLMQKRIAQYPEIVQSILYKTLLNISIGEDDSFLFSHGFSFTGILAVFDCLLKKRMDKDKRKRVLVIINGILCLIYHFPFMLVQALIFRILGFLPIETKRKTGIGLIITMGLFPQMICTISFLTPCIFRLSYLLGKRRRSVSFLILLCLQSAFYRYVNPFQCCMYSFLRILCGWLWFFSIAQLILPIPFVHSFLFLNRLFSFHENLVLHGSIIGAGFPVYLLFVYSYRKQKHFIRIALITFFIFFATGMFHPFGEVSYINVGQGDSILIRYPFNLDNVMIDTGKPEQYKNIQSFLDAKGIHRIHTLVITHDDLDHSGNKDNVCNNYHVRQMITSHQDQIQSRFLQFADLNDINNEDTNESSIVLFTQINHKKFLFMADADQMTEENIIEKYGNLNCDVLKLSHHGSKTGSCDRFLDTVKPGIAIVSSGAYAIYHHPSPVVIQRLLKRHIPYFDTKEEGDISIFFLPGFCILLTSSGRICFF